MIKVQQFFMKYKRYILLINTVLLLFAEVSKLLLHMDIPYQVLMFIVGTIGVIPIALTAISSLRVRLVSIDVLVSLAVIGAFMTEPLRKKTSISSILVKRFLLKPVIKFQWTVRLFPASVTLMRQA